MSDRIYYLLLDLYNEANDIFYELPYTTRDEFFERLLTKRA